MTLYEWEHQDVDTYRVIKNLVKVNLRSWKTMGDKTKCAYESRWSEIYNPTKANKFLPS